MRNEPCKYCLTQNYRHNLHTSGEHYYDVIAPVVEAERAALRAFYQHLLVQQGKAADDFGALLELVLQDQELAARTDFFADEIRHRRSFARSGTADQPPASSDSTQKQEQQIHGRGAA